jgi:hypothetical protein
MRGMQREIDRLVDGRLDRLNDRIRLGVLVRQQVVQDSQLWTDTHFLGTADTGLGAVALDDEFSPIDVFEFPADIGKIGISETILNKPGRLDDFEWEQIKKHPEIGYRILVSSKEFSDIADFILMHHEKWDGTGYPKGLKENEILLPSRIISIADAYDAMTSERSYRNTIDKHSAIQEILRCSGTQFDPEIVKIFIDNFKNDLDQI